MSIKAYNRGTALLRRQIETKRQDAESVNADLQIERLREQIASLESDLEKARRCVGVLRIQQMIERGQFRELQEENEALKKDRATWAKAFLQKQRQVKWLSALIRRFISPTQVDEFRLGR